MEEEEEPQLFSNSNHVILKASLIKHFSYGYTNGQIHWPKCFSKFQRKAMPILRTVLSRAEACLRARLLIQPSNLRRRNPLSGVYDMPIGESYIPEMVHVFVYTFWVYRMRFTLLLLVGNGLFCKEFIRRGQQIVHFVGKVLATREELLQAEQVSNHGGYVITNETGTWGLDCFKTAARQQCFASMANSPYMCKDVARNTHPTANVQKSCKRMGNGTCVFGLIASQDIPDFTEISLNYGPSYIFPSHYY
jgi:hypothetical protein